VYSAIVIIDVDRTSHKMTTPPTDAPQQSKRMQQTQAQVDEVSAEFEIGLAKSVNHEFIVATLIA